MRSDDHFIQRARYIRSLAITVPVNELGGYGADGEVIYERHPEGSPAVLSDTCPGASAVFTSNGSVSFAITRPDGLQIDVLSESFDRMEKRETGVLSGNVWLELTPTGSPSRNNGSRIASLVNPSLNIGLNPSSIRIVKVHRNPREIFYCASFGRGKGDLASVVRMALVATASGPAIVRQVYLENLGTKPLHGNLWAFFDLHGTQFQSYDMEIWYDMGMPISPAETVVSCTVPFTDMVQIKCVRSQSTNGLRPLAATCDYRSFVGDTAQFTLLPEAVRRGSLISRGAGHRLNRFTVPTIAANQFELSLPALGTTVLHQALLYVTDESLAQTFRCSASAEKPGYEHLGRSFMQAARRLLSKTPGVHHICRPQRAPKGADACFRIELPAAAPIAEFLNSVAGGVSALYGRTFGRRIADGVELPFRDRCQDMWPMMKLDPSRVRRDLVHTFGFMYHLCDAPIQSARQLTVAEKLHGGFPRQYPSLWNDRTQPVTNDNRFYADSGIWLLDSLARYIRETGDVSALCEQVGTVEFVDIAEPGRGIRGAATIHSVAETALEILARYERLCADSPYGMVQILTGDWCDPVDMFGTDKIGDASRRGHGRGINARLSAHVFLTTLSTIEMLEAPGVVDALGPTFPSRSAVCRLRRFAETLRQSILRHAWEDGGNHCGFIDSIHELNADGRVPDAHKGEVGYTLGSIRPEREFDGIPRRVLTSMAFGLGLLLADRPYLSPIPDRDAKVAALLKTVDELLYHPEVGLRLYSTALANDEKTRRMVGRMGIIPSGCSENGEYHHAQAMMHRFRIEVPGESNTVWSQLGAILSVTRDAGLLGPFDSMANSYASDPKDPHFGAGMIFGFSGSADWIIDVVERIVGLELNLANGREPALRIRPNLPAQLGGRLTFSRVIHQHTGEGRFRQIPLHVRVRPANGRAEPRIMINGKAATEATIASLDAVDSIEIEMAIVG